jgi:hypothetical protein
VGACGGLWGGVIGCSSGDAGTGQRGERRDSSEWARECSLSPVLGVNLGRRALGRREGGPALRSHVLWRNGMLRSFLTEHVTPLALPGGRVILCYVGGVAWRLFVGWTLGPLVKPAVWFLHI